MATPPRVFEGLLISSPWLNPGQGFVAVPASNATALANPTRAIIVTTAGNLGVVMADGTNNNSQLIAVTVTGQPIPFSVTQTTANNTAVILGITWMPIPIAIGLWIVTQGGDAGGAGNDAIELEDGTGDILIEDASGVILLET